MENREIERKFLVLSDAYVAQAAGYYKIKQGYLSVDKARTVRVRLRDDEGFLTIKGEGEGISRFEWERPVSAADAEALFPLCLPGVIEKTRYIVPLENGLKVEVDVFAGDNEGLVFAEVELPTEDTQFVHPEWLGEEVTEDVRYYNSYLSEHPYSKWKNDK